MPVIPISKIVSVTITRDTARVDEVSFDIPLIAGDAGTFVDRVTTVESMTDVALLYATSDPEYIAANAIFSQSPRITEVKFGRLASKVAQQTTLTFSSNLITGNIVNGKINSVAIAPVPFNTTHDQTMTDLASVINALPAVNAVVTGGPGSLIITITSATAGLPFTATEFVVTGGASQATCTIVTTVANHGIAEDLNEIVAEDDDWYGLIYCERTQTFVEECAEWVQSKIKMFITASDNTDILDDTIATDIASVLSAANYGRTAVLFSDDVDNYPDAAWMGKCFVYEPGTLIWAYKQLSGITHDDLTSAQCTNAEDKNCNVYVSIGGTAITLNGVMANGDFMDIQPFVDWLEARSRENVYDSIVSNVRIPYTDAGIAIVETALMEILQGAENDDKITKDPKYTIISPKASEVSDSDRENRILNDVKFTCTYSSGIQKVNITGILSL